MIPRTFFSRLFGRTPARPSKRRRKSRTPKHPPARVAEILEDRTLLTINLVDTGLPGVPDLTHVGDLTWTEDIIVDGDVEVVVTGVFGVGGDLTIGQFVDILGNDDGQPDRLTIRVAGDAEILGEIGGGGLTDFSLTSAGTIDVADFVTIDIVGGGLNLTATAGAEQTLASIAPVFDETSASAAITVGNATLSADNIVINTNASTTKSAIFDIFEDSVPGLAAGATTALMTGDPGLEFTPDDRSTVTRTAGSWLLDGFAPGMEFLVTGTEDNDGLYTIDSAADAVSNDVLKLVTSDDIVAETVPAGSGVLVEQPFSDFLPEEVPMIPTDANGIPDISAGGFTAGDISTALQGVLIDSNVFDAIPIPAEVLFADSSSTITIESGAELTATGDIDINALAVSNVALRTPAMVLGAAHANSDATARAIVESGASINAGGNFSLDAQVDNDLDLTVLLANSFLINKVAGSAPGPSVIKMPFGIQMSIAVGFADSESEAVLESGSTVEATNVAVSAKNSNDFKVAAMAKASPKSIGAGIGIAVSDVESDSEARIDGTVTATDKVSVSATSTNANNDVRSVAVVKDKLPRPLQAPLNQVSSFQDKVNSTSAELRPETLGQQPPPSGKKLDISASFAYARSANMADASIGGSAVINASGDVTVNGKAEDNFKSIAVGGAKASAAISAGGAVSFSAYENEAYAAILDGATVNSGGALDVMARAVVPNQIGADDDLNAVLGYRPEAPSPAPGLDPEDGLPFFESLLSSTSLEVGKLTDVLGRFIGYISLNLGIPGNVATTFVATAAAAKDEEKNGTKGKFAISGSIDLLDVTNMSSAWIGEGADLNTDPMFAGPSQTVSVDASASIETINVGGIGSVLSLIKGSTKSDGGAVGGTYGDIDYRNTALAWIDDGATVHAGGDVNVTADTHALAVNVMESGTNGQDFGISGSFSINIFDTMTSAWIEDTAVVTSGGNVNVLADNDVLGVIANGTVAKSGQVGVGVAVALNAYEGETYAFIGDLNESDFPRPAGSVTAAGDIVVETSSDQKLVSVGVAAAIASGQDPAEEPEEGESASDQAADNGVDDTGTQKESQDTKDDDDGDGGEGDGNSDDDADSAALLDKLKSIVPESAQSKGADIVAKLKSLGPAAKETGTGLKNSASEKLGKAKNAPGQAVNKLKSLAGKGDKDESDEEKQKKSFGIGVSGDAALNLIDESVKSFISDGVTVTANAGDLTVHAVAEAVNVNGTMAISADTSNNDKGAALAGSAAITVLDRVTHAYIDSATVAADYIFVDAYSQDRSIDVTAGGAGANPKGQSTVAVAGSAAAHFATNETFAWIGDSISVTASGDLTVKAANSVFVVSVAGAVAVSGHVGVGGALDLVIVVNRANAWIGDDAIVVAGGNVRVTADNDQFLIAFAGSLAVSTKKVALSGSGAVQIFLTDTDAHIGDRATVTTSGSILVAANDEIFNVVVGGSVAGGQQGVGASLSGAFVVRDVAASIGEDASVTAGGNGDPLDMNGVPSRGLVVYAGADDQIHVVGAAGAFAQEKALAGGWTPLIVVSDVVALIDDRAMINAVNDGAHRDQSVAVLASHDAEMRVLAGALNISNRGSGAAGALGSFGVYRSVSATIDQSANVKARNDVEVRADSFDRAVSLIAAGGASLQNQFNGTASLAVYVNETRATIANDATVFADGNVVVAAQSESQIVAGVGGVGIGLQNSFGGSLATVIHVDITEAWIGDRADVTALGSGDTSEVPAGTRSESFLDPDTETIRGLSVTATSFEALSAASAGAQGAANTAVAGSLAVAVLVEETKAWIGESAIINDGRDDARDVSVRASDDTFVINLAGAVAAAGTTAVDLGAALGIVIKDTHAWLGDSADVTSGGDVSVASDSKEQLVTITVGAQGAGTTGVGVTLSAFGVGTSTHAWLGEDSTVNADGTVAVTADSDHEADFGTGQVGGAGSTAIGGALSILVHVASTHAWVADRATVNATGNGAGVATNGSMSSGLVVSADASENIVLATLVVEGGGAVGLAGADGTVVLYEETQAWIDDSVAVNTDTTNFAGGQDVRVRAHDDTSIVSVTTSGAGGGTVGIGGALDTGAVVKNTDAWIADATVRGQNVSVTSESDEFVASAAAALGASGTAGIAASAAVYAMVTETTSSIRDNATVFANGNAVVAARSDAEIIMTADQVSASGVAAVSGSGTVLVHVDTAQAWIGIGADVVALGHGPGSAVPGLDDLISGLSVTALSSEEVTSVAAGAAGAQNAAVAGSITANVLVETTEARIAETARINDTTEIPSTDQDVIVMAGDDSIVRGAGGTLTIAITIDGGAAVGGSLDAGVITKTTTAEIGDDAVVNADGNVIVDATSSEEIVSVAATSGIGAGLAVGIAGAAGVNTAFITTRSRIGKRTRVMADGTVVVSADDDLDLISADGTVAVGLAAGGASLSVSVFQRDVEAYIDELAVVDGSGHGSGVDARTGSIAVSLDGYVPEIGELLPAIGEDNGGHRVLPSGMDEARFLDEKLTRKRNANAETAVQKGVVVSATSTADVTKFTAAGAASGFSLTFSGAATAYDNGTKAWIGEKARVNTSDDGTASGEQSVRVGAGTDFSSLTLSGGASIGVGQSAAGAAVDLVIVDQHTEAWIADGADVRAAGDVRVTAESTEDTLSLAAGLAAAGGSQTFAVGGSFAFVFIDSTTEAYIGSETSTGMPASVVANGNVLVSASDDTDTDIFAGAAGISLDLAGVAGSLSTVPIEKSTRAWIGPYAMVTANGATTPTVDTVEIDEQGERQAAAVHGAVVEATSTDSVFAVSVSGGGGAFVGVAGAASLELIDSDTLAWIGDNAVINADTSGASAHQDVRVVATNEVNILAAVGSLAGSGIGALAGGLDLGLVRNDTKSHIGREAQVNAAHDVAVDALGRREFTSFVVSAAGSQVGIGGAASILVNGGNLDDDGTASITANDGSGETVTFTSESELDSLLNLISTDAGTGLLDQYLSEDSNGPDDQNPDLTETSGTTVADAMASFRAARRNGSVQSTVDTQVDTTGTSAWIDAGAAVDAGNDVHVKASDTQTVLQVAGGAGIGLSPLFGGIGVGGSVAVTINEQDVTAFIAESATVDAGGSITVSTMANSDLDARGFAGGAGGLIGLGAQVVVARDTGDSTAFVDDGAHLNQAATVTVQAMSDRDVTVFSIGGAAGLVAAGVSVARGDVTGDTAASVGENVMIGTNPEGAVGGLTISAQANAHVDSRAIGVAAGALGAGSGADADATMNSDVTASIGSSSMVHAAGDVRVEANAGGDLDAEADGGTAGAVAVGVMLADANVSGTRDATIDSGVSIDAGSLTVDASSTFDADAVTRAAAGGIFGGLGNVATAVIDPTVNGVVGDDAVVELTGTLNVNAESSGHTTADAFGVNVGTGVGIGISEAQATSSSDVVAAIGDRTEISANRSTLHAWGDQTADAMAHASGGGLRSGNGAIANARVDPTINAQTGRGSQVRTNDDIEIAARSEAAASADATGATVAGLTIGHDTATAEVVPVILATPGADSRLTSQAGTVSVVAEHNATADSKNNAAVASAGPSGSTADNLTIAGIAGTGATADGLSSPSVTSLLPATVAVDAAGLDVIARSYSNATAEGKSTDGVFAGIGVVTADATGAGDTRAAIGSSQVLIDDGATNVVAESSHTATAEATAASYGGGATNATVANASIGNSGAIRTLAELLAGSDVSGITDVTLRAEAKTDADAEADGDNIGALGVGVSLANADIDVNVDAIVRDGATVDTNSLQAVATHNYSSTDDAPIPTPAGEQSQGAEAEAESAGGGVLVGSGAISTATVDAEVDSQIESGAIVNTAGEITVLSRASNVAEANSKGFAGGAIAVGVSQATADATGVTRSRLHESVTTVTGGLTIDAWAKEDATASAKAARSGVLSGSGSDADATISSDVRAVIGSNITVDIGGNVRLNASSEMNLDALADGNDVTRFGAATIGVSDADATVDRADVLARINRGATVITRGTGGAEGNVELVATRTGTANANASGSGGALLAGIGATADANVDTGFVRAHTEADVELISAGDVAFQAESDLRAEAETNSSTIGVATVGQSRADASVNDNDTRSWVGPRSTVDVAGDLSVNSLSNNVVKSRAFAAEAGFASAVTILGAEALSENNGVEVDSFIGENAGITVGGNLAMSAGFEPDVDATAKGTTDDDKILGGADVGQSRAKVNRDANVDVFVDSNAVVHVGDDAMLFANHKHTFTNKADSEASLGGLVTLLGSGNAIAYASSDTTATTELRTNAILQTDGSASLESRAGSNTQAEASNRVNGILADGDSEAEAETDSNAWTRLLDGARIMAGGDVDLIANNVVDGDSRAKDAAGDPAVFQDAEAEATTRVKFDTSVTTADSVVINSDSTITARADTDVERARSRAEVDLDDVSLDDDAIAKSRTIVNDGGSDSPLVTRVEVNGSELIGRSVNLAAVVSRFETETEAETDATAANVDVTADAEIRASALAEVLLGDNTKVVGFDDVSILARHTKPSADLEATADSLAAIGSTHVDADLDLIADSKVQTSDSATVITSDLHVEAGVSDVDIDRDAEKRGAIIDDSCDTFDLSCHFNNLVEGIDFVIDTILGEPREFEDVSVDTTNEQDIRIDFSSHVVVLSTTPTLIVPEDGSLDPVVDQNIDEQITANEVIVNGVEASPGAVRFEIEIPRSVSNGPDFALNGPFLSSDGGLFGNATIDSATDAPLVRIENRSSRDLVLNALQQNLSAGPPTIEMVQTDRNSGQLNLTMSSNPGPRTDFSTFTIGGMVTTGLPSLFDIDNIGPPDLFVNGLIDNTAGSISLTNTGGPITVDGAAAVSALNELGVSAAGDFLIEAGATINAGDDVTLTADTLLTLESGASVSGDALLIQLDPRNTTAGSTGATAQIDGQLMSARGITFGKSDADDPGNAADDSIRLTNLSGVTAPDGIQVDLGGGTNSLVIDNTSDAAGATGSLSDHQLLGLGLPVAGLHYHNLTSLDISLGDGDDDFTFDDSAAGTATSLTTGDGLNQITVGATHGPLDVMGGPDEDTFRVHGENLFAPVEIFGGVPTAADIAGTSNVGDQIRFSSDIFDVTPRTATTPDGVINAHTRSALTYSEIEKFRIITPIVEYLQPEFRVDEDGRVIGTEITLIRIAEEPEDLDTDSIVRVTPVDLDAVGSSGGVGADFDSDPIIVEFAGRSVSETVFIPITDDDLAELDESLELQVGGVRNARPGDQPTATLEIFDNDCVAHRDFFLDPTRIPGDVEASVVGNDLILLGDLDDNTVNVFVDDNGDVLVGGRGDTTINGLAEPFVAFSGTGTIPGSLRLLFAQRNILACSLGVEIAGDLIFTSGLGLDGLGVAHTDVGGNAIVRIGGGDSNVKISHSRIDGVTDIATASGDDDIQLTGSHLNGPLVLYAGLDDDTVLVDGTTIDSNAYLFGELGSDAFGLTETTVTGLLLVNTGDQAGDSLFADVDAPNNVVLGLGFDFGDAPDPEYPTLLTSNGPWHHVVANLRIGSLIDTETDGQPNATATGDDIAVADDEDSIGPLALVVGDTPTLDIPVVNTTGRDATLYGWIDYNGDGVFDNATERASIAVPDGTNGDLVTLTLPVVPQHAASETVLRLRLSTYSSAADPTGFAADGEVEDHAVTIRTYDHIVGRNPTTGQWQVARSDGTGFTNEIAGFWSTAVTWVDVMTGDVNGDGLDDIVGREQAGGNWWVAINNGTTFTNERWGRWTPIGWADVNLADVNGDGLIDIVGREQNSGRWWVALSDGIGFTNQLWGQWTPANWENVDTADVNGDGLDDIVGRNGADGRWWVALSDGSGFTNELWGFWTVIPWSDINITDVNGDGMHDVIGRETGNGRWWVGLSDGTGFANTLWGHWSPVAWVDTRIADLNGDGLYDVISREQTKGRWWAAISNGAGSSSNVMLGTWDPSVDWQDLQIGDFNADGRDDVAGRRADTGEWQVGESTGSRLAGSVWGLWDPDELWADAGVLDELLTI